ncbi:MAG: sigma-70 family RNA polymerase sigma factor [Candidatus Dojkabacteria bacterium]|nr:MAG: sigma-70 family RNA polymerase sigma factor [Candidatus Dojkabacteria bacterium]
MEYSDSQLVEMALRNRENFRLIYDKYFASVYKYSVYAIFDPANVDDVVSETFIKVYKNLRKFDPKKATLKTWIFNITRNTSTDWNRKRKWQFRRFMAVDHEIPDRSIDLELGELMDEEYIMLRDAVRNLPENERIVIECRFFDNFAVSEIAQVTGLTEKGVYSAIYRGLKKIKSGLKE